MRIGKIGQICKSVVHVLWEWKLFAWLRIECLDLLFLESLFLVSLFLVNFTASQIGLILTLGQLTIFRMSIFGRSIFATSELWLIKSQKGTCVYIQKNERARQSIKKKGLSVGNFSSRSWISPSSSVYPRLKKMIDDD